jgi:hypothetical protein
MPGVLHSAAHHAPDDLFVLEAGDDRADDRRLDASRHQAREQAGSLEAVRSRAQLDSALLTPHRARRPLPPKSLAAPPTSADAILAALAGAELFLAKAGISADAIAQASRKPRS